MEADVIVVGGGAAGLMAAQSAASGSSLKVVLLEKMPRTARKIMITGKGRCNFSNLKTWNEFSGHVSSNAKFPRSAFMSLTPEALRDWFESQGLPTILERGDRLFPSSGQAASVVDCLTRACEDAGVEIVTQTQVSNISKLTDGRFCIETTQGPSWNSRAVIITTGGLSYPSTGSTGDGYCFARSLGHKIVPTFPSLTALVPRGYKILTLKPESKGHISRNEPLTALGQALCGINLDNVQVTLKIDGQEADSQMGDISFTDGGLEGPVGYKLSRRAVKAILNGSKAAVSIDLKPAVSKAKLTGRITSLFSEPKARPEKVLASLLPREFIKPFVMSTGLDHFTPEGLASTLKNWELNIDGYVGYERAVVTAGGVSLDEIYPKTMGSRLVNNLYFAGEVLDIDAMTGGYNLHLAFATGHLAGLSAAEALIKQ